MKFKCHQESYVTRHENWCVVSGRIICVLTIFSSFTYVMSLVWSEEMKSKDQRRPGHSLIKRFHDDTQYSLYTHKIFIEAQFNEKEKTTLRVTVTMSSMSCADSLSVVDSLLCGDDDINTEVQTSSALDSLPTFQMFREKKARVEAELRYHYRLFQILEFVKWFTMISFQSDVWK